MRHVGPYSECGETWDKFVPWMGSQGLLGGDTAMFAICHDDPDVVDPASLLIDNDGVLGVGPANYKVAQGTSMARARTTAPSNRSAMAIQKAFGMAARGEQ